MCNISCNLIIFVQWIKIVSYFEKKHANNLNLIINLVRLRKFTIETQSWLNFIHVLDINVANSISYKLIPQNYQHCISLSAILIMHSFLSTVEHFTKVNIVYCKITVVYPFLVFNVYSTKFLTFPFPYRDQTGAMRTCM